MPKLHRLWNVSDIIYIFQSFAVLVRTAAFARFRRYSGLTKIRTRRRSRRQYK
ncbi:TPA: hypothetical protein WHP42_000871 [Neisseria meningitidis]|uniref:hypothetical protein n=1 Tax=Neisseria meningitidis TaxID=487 RepID=UPI0002DF2F89|nr:hypothetical protein [Neisseria meningitidis]MCL4995986.1 hypothetical protein [Neisseria meningitidis]MCL5686655.1 hypothetical protein [Neisseria meningitidis]RGB20247.1 glycosyl transferase family 1 [Neisseria meningitidis]RNJ81780.1 glycosyl transferase family 1 [Neisseria meningitidis]RQJ65346.1 glycosyl transferase family 1 [Neisseria meningitidis]